MRKRCFAILAITFCLLTVANGQESSQDENRDRAMAVPSSQRVAPPSLGHGAPMSGRPIPIRNTASPENAASADGGLQAPHSGLIHNRQAENAASTQGESSSSNGLPVTTSTQAPAGGRYVFGQSDYVTPLNPRSVVRCDFNGDGVPDFAVSDSNDTTVTVFIGRPDGTMVSAPSFNAGHNVTYVGAYLGCGDFNKDGFADLVTVSGDGFVDVYLSNGDGSFRAPIEYSTPSGILDMTVADLDKDGNLDLISEGNLGSVLVFYGHGDGTFAPYSAYPITGYSHGPAPVAVGDLNGDGKMDMAVVRSNYVCVLLNNGARSFQPCSNYGTFNDLIYGVAIGDFNGDHKLDLALSKNSIPGTVSILLGAGDGSFPTHTEYPVALSPRNIAVTDLNDDGKLDVISAGVGSRGGAISVLLGDGDGTFKDYVAYGTGGTPTMLLGDFNGDGVPDLAIAAQSCLSVHSQCLIGNLSLWLGHGDGSFPSGGTSYPMPNNATAVAAGDLNGDGRPDIVVGNQNGENNNTLSVLINNGDGTFQPRVDYEAGSGTTSVVVGDFNGDRLMDVAVANVSDSTVSILLSNGNGSLQPHQDYPTAGSGLICVGDFNHDGAFDLVTASTYSSYLSILLGYGNGTFHPYSQVWAGISPAAIAVGDVNNDGKLDVVLLNNRAIAVLLGNGDGTFKAPIIQSSTVSSNWGTLGDFNGDGKLDLAVTDVVSAWLFPGNGDGTFQAPISFNTGGVAASVAAADTNVDGKLDLVYGGMWNAGILYGDGRGGFAGYSTYLFGWGDGSSFATADFSGNGGTDLARENWYYTGYASQLTMLLNNPVIALYPSNLSFAPTVLGDTSLPRDLLISNPGSAPVKLSSIVVAGDFAQINNCPETLGVGQSCTITATFTPTDLGVRTGSITILDNALSGTQVIHLSGVASSALKLSSTSVSFGAPPGKTYSSPVTLSNRSSQNILISKIVISGRDSADFSQTNNCNNIVPAHGSCVLTLTFKPTKTGTKLAGASISDSDPGSPQVIIMRGISRY